MESEKAALEGEYQKKIEEMKKLEAGKIKDLMGKQLQLQTKLA